MSVLTFPVEAGTRGLRRELLHHLVESRYAAALAGSPAWAVRSFAQIHESVGHACAPTTEHTREALLALTSLGLIESVDAAAGSARWRATPAGVRVIDRSHEYAEMRAA